ESFYHFNGAPLKEEEKKQFIQAWGDILSSDKDQRSFVETLEPLVCYSRKVAKLCENVFLLALISQIQLLDGMLPIRRIDVYRRAIELMVEQQRQGRGLPLTVNEVYPHLEHLAYCMRSEGSQYWSETKIIRAIEELREHEEEAELKRRSPSMLLDAVMRRLGVLNVAGGSEVDQRGYERRVIQFFHQSFQEYFAAQALRHGRGVYDGTGILDRLREKVHGIPIVERKIESLGMGTETEPVTASQWQEVVRMCISGLSHKEENQNRRDKADADDAMLMLLPSAGTSPRDSRALAVFALQCLADEPELTEETVYTILDIAIDCVSDLDGMNTKQNTLMDEAFYAVMQSCYRDLCTRRLLHSYIQSRDQRRHKIGCIFSLCGSSESLNADNAARILRPTLNRIKSNEKPDNQVAAALQLVDIFYRPQGQNSNIRIDFLDAKLLQETVSTLLEAATGRIKGHAALQGAALWALSWLVTAKVCQPNKIYAFDSLQLDYLREIIIDEKKDSFARGWAASILGSYIAYEPVFTQVDWVYEWAVVADGGKPQKHLPVAKRINHNKDVIVLRHLLVSNVPIKVKERVALSLGRLNHFSDEVLIPLLNIFQDDLSWNKERDEALIYLVLSGSAKVDSVFLQGAARIVDDTDLSQYGFPARCHLALMGRGYWKSLYHQLNLCLGSQADIDSYAYALAGIEDSKGREVLISVTNHQKEKVQIAVSKAVTKFVEWTYAVKKPVCDQVNWLSEWATVATGYKPHWQLPMAKVNTNRKKTEVIKSLILEWPQVVYWFDQWMVDEDEIPQQVLLDTSSLENSTDEQVLARLLSSKLPIEVKNNVAIIMGRLGYFVSGMIEPLLHIFKYEPHANIRRDEALVYLVLMGGTEVISALIEGLSVPRKETDKYNFPSHCLLGLIGIGDLNALQELLTSENEKFVTAAAYALAGNADIQGKRILLSTSAAEVDMVREAVSRALDKTNEWRLPER
ncbi:hypothetical protein, partial [cf. Phormidesmis sp. LEGE 11477]|uniref:hypothetical protein n=1 Tax=cf. Phormidesmis sp. LEGE 11477 TaxID=1828680 RepID=UPI00188045A6